MIARAAHKGIRRSRSHYVKPFGVSEPQNMPELVDSYYATLLVIRPVPEALVLIVEAQLRREHDVALNVLSGGENAGIVFAPSAAVRASKRGSRDNGGLIPSVSVRYLAAIFIPPVPVHTGRDVRPLQTGIIECGCSVCAIRHAAPVTVHPHVVMPLDNAIAVVPEGIGLCILGQGERTNGYSKKQKEMLRL